MARKRYVQAVLAITAVCTFLFICGYQTFNGTFDPELKQTLIIAVSTSLGYFLGSSDGSARKTDQLPNGPEAFG